MNAYRASTQATYALPKLFSEFNTPEGTPALPEGSTFYHVPKKTFALQLPAYMTVTDRTPVTLEDGGRLMNHGGCGCQGDKAAYPAELHLYYCPFPGLLRACLCVGLGCSCLDYAALWERLLQETARPTQLSKSQIPAALSAWHQWAKQQQALGHDLKVITAQLIRWSCHRIHLKEYAHLTVQSSGQPHLSAQCRSSQIVQVTVLSSHGWQGSTEQAGSKIFDPCHTRCCP